MSYEKGELMLGENYTYKPDPNEPKIVAKLPHSCDEWIIGGPEQIRWLIADLEAALKELEP